MSIPALTVGMLALLLTLASAGFGQTSSPSRIWIVVAADAKSDGRDASLADAAQLSYLYDPLKDELWFRVTLYGLPNEETFGINIVFDTGADDSSKTRYEVWVVDSLILLHLFSSCRGFCGRLTSQETSVAYSQDRDQARV